MAEAGHIYRDDAEVSFAASAIDAAKGADALVIDHRVEGFPQPGLRGAAQGAAPAGDLRRAQPL
jgi:hypothetical protein